MVSQEPYINYKVGFNNILIDPKDNDKSFIIRDGKILAFIDKDKIFLYSPDKSSPFEDNAVIKYYYKEPAIQYNSRETIYYDKNLDGIDIEFKKTPFLDNRVNILSAEGNRKPNGTIIKAIIPNKVCIPLVGTIACCLESEERYQPYIFSYDKGWEVFDNYKTNKLCNTNDFNFEKRKLNEEIYQNN